MPSMFYESSSLLLLLLFSSSTVWTLNENHEVNIIRYDEHTRRAFSLLDLFSGDGIFSRIPQLIIDIISFFAGLFPSQNNDYDVPEYTPDPDSEPITTSAYYRKV